MSSVYDSIYSWARRTTTSFAELRFVSSERDDIADDPDSLIYRLKHWPDLPETSRTAGVYRALSMMSNRPVNRRWILNQSKLRPEQLDRLLERLTEEGAIEVIDASRYACAEA